MDGRTHFADDATLEYISKIEREVEELKAQHALVWDEAIQAAVGALMNAEKQRGSIRILRAIPNPYAARKEHEPIAT